MIQGSIRTRLTTWYTAVLSLALILFSCTVWLGLRYVLFHDLASRLTDQARGLEEYLRIENRRTEARLAHEVDEYSRTLPEHHLLFIKDERGHLLFTGSPAHDEPVNLPAQLQPHRLTWNDHHYLAVTRKIAWQNEILDCFLAIPSDQIERPIRLLEWLLLLTVPAFILCGAGGGYLLSRRALMPVDRITERARTIGLQNLSERLPVPATRDEIQRLTQTWNDMLARLEVAVSKITQFTADASHELRTPIAIVRFAAENALRKMRSEPEYRAALDRIQNESESMTRLVEDLLFLARADVELSGIQPEPVDLSRLVITACTDLQPLAAAKGISLIQSTDHEDTIVLGDPAALRRMLLILLDNGIKYTPEGGSVSVSLQEIDGVAILSVEDTGAGIPADLKHRVFERFFRADPSRNKNSGGHGLGLAIAHTIVGQHHATIELESNAAGGCVFTVAFPHPGSSTRPSGTTGALHTRIPLVNQSNEL